MADIRNYTMNLSFDITFESQVSLRCNKALTRLVVGRDYALLRPEVHG